MKPDPKWSFVLTVLLFSGMMIGLSLSVLNDLMVQTAALSGRDMFVMTMHVIWLLLWSIATVFALKVSFLPPRKKRGKNLTQTARSARNPATTEY